MIDAVDRQLTSWADGIVGTGLSKLTAPGAQQGPRGVSLYLMDVISSPPPRAARKIHLEISLRYLIDTWSADAAEDPQLLGDLLFAALANADFSVEPGPIATDMWISLGVPPRAGFLMRVPLAKDLPERPSKYVRQVVVKTTPSTSIAGLVTGPGDIPLSGALVQLPGLNL